MANYRLRIGYTTAYALSANAGTYTLSGQDTSIVAQSLSDWNTRASAPGVVLADRLQTSDKLVATSTISATQWLLANGNQGHVTLDTTTKVSDAAGSYKFAVLNADGTDSGDVGVYFGNLATFGQGSTVWYSYRVYAPPEFVYAPWPFESGTGGGSHKVSILSRHTSSNQPNEVVIQINYTANQWNGYWQDGQSSSVLTDVGIDTSGSGGSSSDIRRQPAVDNGANSLTGTNPDTGSAWTAYEQTRARYGLLYNAQNTVADLKRGLGDPFSGGITQSPNVWFTIISRVAIGTWGNNNSQWTLWVAKDGEAPKLIHDAQNIRLGSGPDYNCLWLLPYVSNRVSGGRKVTTITNPIAGLTVHGAAGLSTPIGDGQLEYNATTGRARWRGLSETYGTARGFSSSNDILTRNLVSNNTDSYVQVTAVPASLPSSGTHTATITVADGRPDTQVNYNDVIISNQVIKAPGGYLPSGLSTIETAAAGMSSGQWLNFGSTSGTTGLAAFTGGTGASGVRTPFMSEFTYDPLRKRFLAHTGDHAEDAKLFRYEFSTNGWVIDHSASWMSTGGQATARHGYDHNVFARDTFYSRTLQSLFLRRWNGGTSWTDIPIPFDYTTSAAGQCYHAALGQILIFQLESGTVGELQGYDPSTGLWTVHSSAGSGLLNPAGDPHNFAVYNPISQIAWFGGGNDVTTNWTINASGTIQAASAIPSALSMIGPGSGPSLALANPSNGNFTVFRYSNVWYDFNATTRTYTAKTGTASAFVSNMLYQNDQAADGMAGVMGCTVPELGVMVFVKAWSRGSAAEMWLYKP